jgi:hypothetical protein
MNIIKETIRVREKILKIKIPEDFLNKNVEITIKQVKQKKRKKLHEIFLHPIAVKNLKLPSRDSLYER